MILKVYDRAVNRVVDFFHDFNLTLKYDSLGSTFSFSAFWEPTNAEHKLIFKPSMFYLAKIEHEGELLFTGFMVNHRFGSENTRSLVTVSGYSLPGVLEDCQIPTSAYPLQSDGLTLKQIAEKVLKPFRIGLVIDDSAESLSDKRLAAKRSKRKTLKGKISETIRRSTADASKTVKEYLTDLASQKNVIISHTAKGEVLFTTAKTNQQPIFHFENTQVGVTFDLSFGGQSIHSHITVLKQADLDGGNAGESTILNNYVPRGILSYRPRVVVQNSGSDTDTEEASDNIRAAELKNIILTINLDRITINGILIRPNNIITVTNPEVYIYKKTRWFIESVTYTGDSESMTCVLTCVLPCVYDGTVPENIFL